MKRHEHWDGVYTAKNPDEVSWYQPIPKASLEILERTGAKGTGEVAVIDVGGGASTLVDNLLDHGLGPVTVLDLSARALERARARLGPRAEPVDWVVADVTQWTPSQRYRIWHDRAVLHFLTEDADRAAYFKVMDAALEPGGHAILAGFAPDGPERCSGLPVRRAGAAELALELGDGFVLLEEAREEHVTPGGIGQRFAYALFRKKQITPAA